MANIIDLGKIYQYEALPKTINDKLIKHDTIEFEKLMTPLNSHFEAKKHFLSPPPAPESCPYTKLTKSMDELSSLVNIQSFLFTYLLNLLYIRLVVKRIFPRHQ